MKKKNNLLIFLLLLISSSLIMGTGIHLILINSYANSLQHNLSGFTELVVTRYPEAEQDIVKMIKDSTVLSSSSSEYDDGILSKYGYTPEVFAEQLRKKVNLYIFLTLPIWLFLLLFLYLLIKNSYKQRIAELTHFLEKVNYEKEISILSRREDDFSQLEDEIYKTVTKLRQMKENAVKERETLADNLADISHQIKTPVTSISLMTQLLDHEQNHDYIVRIQKQTTHLEQLVHALLTLSRIDAGALRLKSEPVDIYTMLSLSLDALDEIISQKQILIILPNYPEITYQGDMEWSIEAFINLLKNCSQHSHFGGQIKLDYCNNPLYTEIHIEDNGDGFTDKDLPHIFERFYKGDNAINGGTGIGLSLAKAIIELQNGIIHACNLPGGGALFTIRFYSHQNVTLE